MKPQAYIVDIDIDGTLAEIDDRSPYDYSLVHTDKAKSDVIDLVRSLHGCFYNIVLVTGRPETYREATEAWLKKNFVPYEELHMRPESRLRDKDLHLKADIFHEKIEPRYRVRGVFEDSKRVVDMWRDKGLTVFHVAEGNF